MPQERFREEVLNVALAELLEHRGLLSVPETIRKSIARNTKDLPDIVIADLLGIRIVIEGKFNSGAPAREAVLKQARQRVENGISPVCLAVLYPPEIRSADSLTKLRKNIEKATLGIRVIAENSDGDWSEGTVNDIADTLRRSYELLVSEDVVVSSVAEIEAAIDFSSDVFVHTPSFTDRFRKALGIPANADGKEETED